MSAHNEQGKTDPEAPLVRKAMEGDSEALDKLFARNTRALYQIALRVLGNREDAEDAVQEGLLAAYRNLPRFEGRAKFSTWLTRIVINSARMRLRSLKSRPAVSLDESLIGEEQPPSERFADPGPNPEQVYAGVELADRVEENLEKLSPALSESFRMREIQELSTKETAKALGVSPNALKARIWRARRALATGLEAGLRGAFTAPDAGQEA
jgi:RNA polymerase sigma-70 factor, ECF subfamily